MVGSAAFLLACACGGARGGKERGWDDAAWVALLLEELPFFEWDELAEGGLTIGLAAFLLARVCGGARGRDYAAWVALLL